MKLVLMNLKNSVLFKLFGSLTILVLIAGTAFFFYRRNSFVTATVIQGDVEVAVYALGKVKSHHKFDVILAVMSNVKHVVVEEGSLVKTGAPLLEINGGGVFRAPFAGTITFVKVRTGEIAPPNTVLLREENIQDRFIELTLEQQAALRVLKGQTARVSLESVRGPSLVGKITAVFPREEEFIAQVSVPDLNSNVLPGMTADVTVEVGHIKNAILIPYKAIHNGFVTVRRKDKWKKEKVLIGHIDGINVEVKSANLFVGDKIRLAKEEN
jgi:multidrug efflux pump subunit AcrA (membrane-fusion protein)